MKLYKTDAIVLRTRDYSEADSILTIFTLKRGKVNAIAKGSRKTKSRKRGAVQPFTYSDFMLYQGRSLDTVSQCEPKESFAHLREDLEKLAYSTYIAELTETFTVEGEPNEEMFVLLLTTLYLLVKDDPGMLIRAFELRMLNLLGYCPQLQYCTHCHTLMNGVAKIRFSPKMGGLLCDNCLNMDLQAKAVRPGAINIMKQLLRWDIRRLQVIKVNEEDRKEIAQLLREYICERAERKLKSIAFLDSVLQ